MDWKKYWETRPTEHARADLCAQVGRTLGGLPTPEAELQRVVQDAVTALQLGPEHVLLDLCCGNGLLTSRLGPLCSAVVGVDYSEAMIAIAASEPHPSNVRYLHGSALDLGNLPVSERFSRIIMFESLQYFDALGPVLDSLKTVCTETCRIVFTGVLDRQRLWSFYDTPERRAEYHRRMANETELMGHWWTREELVEPARQRGFTTGFRDQDPALNTAHYRFDLVLDR